MTATASAKLAHFVPTVAAARRAGIALPSATPTQRYPLAALIVKAEILRREVWSEKKSIAAELAESLPEQPPRQGKAGGIYHVVGRRFRAMGGWQGYGALIRVRLDHYSDKLVGFDDAFIPSELSKMPAFYGLELAFETLIMPQTPPECLRCLDLTPRSTGGAYRAGPGARQTKFHGHDFGDTVKRAARTVQNLMQRGQVLERRVRAYGWPILWLHYDTTPARDYALVVDHDGAVRGLTGLGLEAQIE